MDFQTGAFRMTMVQHSGLIVFGTVYEIHILLLGSLKVTRTTFFQLAKSHISAQFFVTVFVLGWYTYFETGQVLFSLCFLEKGVKTLKIYE